MFVRKVEREGRAAGGCGIVGIEDSVLASEIFWSCCCNLSSR